MAPKKILFTNISYLPEVGGVENSLYHLSEASKKNGDYPYLLYGIKGSCTNDVFRRNGIVHITFGRGSGGLMATIFAFTRLLRLVSTINSKISFEKIVQRNHFVALVVNILFKGQTVYLAPGFAKNQHTLKNINAQKLPVLEKKVFQIKSFISRCVDWLALVTTKKIYVFSDNMEVQARDVLGRFNRGREILIVKPGIDVMRFERFSGEKFDLRANKFGFEPDAFIFLALGRCVSAKGFRYILEAANALQNKNKNKFKFKLLIVGDGPELSSYKDYVASNNLEKLVLFVGKVSDPETYYAIADCFVMSSTYEPLGQTLLEAAASQLPIIAFSDNCKVSFPDFRTATEEVLLDIPIYCNSVTEYELSGAMEKVMNMTEQERGDLGAVARAHVARNFSWGKLYADLTS
ncbi:hypothetical protein IDSA_01060 [Pseudidiomarina salinarum]|uniref:Glycosyl transferase family 1 domain-containing protein n=1 Tax=Pseudidiomarina salinarum TaxID=435908 RepID=A0A094L984_9GAMM|nr:glycosyltransferase family 4 protein [Pseudidiomarina salinarum]KFZ31348.1 hypothetical protein IDSA_01060 [Pseudidiomarina salinarum]RUO70893.1 hypothetical protein CWI79_05495 [Pseudidiomarina salinarum]